MTKGSTSQPPGSSPGSPETTRRRNALVVASRSGAAAAMPLPVRTQPAVATPIGLNAGAEPSESSPEPIDPLDPIRTTDAMASPFDHQIPWLALRDGFRSPAPGIRQRLGFATDRLERSIPDALAWRSSELPRSTSDPWRPSARSTWNWGAGREQGGARQSSRESELPLSQSSCSHETCKLGGAVLERRVVRP